MTKPTPQTALRTSGTGDGAEPRARASHLAALDRLVNPRVVAVVGASDRPGPGRNVFLNLAGSASLTVFPVNAKSAVVLGHKAYPSLRDLPARPDLVVVSVAAQVAVEVVAEAGALGIPAAVVLSSGFAELGAEGRALQERLTETARRHGMALCGPNCMGFLNVAADVPAFSGLAPQRHAGGNVACFAQSGSVTVSLVTALGRRVAMAVSAGNQAVSDATDFLCLFRDDPAVRVRGFFLESVPRAREFLAAAKSAGLAGHPVVICRTGRSERGAEATSAHTGALAQPHASFVQIARRHGAVLADDLDEFAATLTLFSAMGGRAPRPGVALASMSGGLNALALDLAEDAGLAFAALAPETLSRLADVLPSYGTPANPLDVTGTVMADEARYTQCLTALAEDPAVNLLAVLIPLPNPDVEASERHRFRYMVEAAAKVGAATGKQVALLSATSGPLDGELVRLCDELGLVLLAGLRAGLGAVARVDAWSRWHHAETGRAAARQDNAAPQIAAVTPPAGPHADPQQALAAAGLPFPAQAVATTLDAALDAAQSIGYPVVLKIASPDIAHKTDVGGVRLGVADGRQLRAEWASMIEEVGRKAPQARIDGVLVAEQVADGVDLIVGLKRDPGLGPLVVVGMGGIHAELFADTAIAQPPLTEAEARALLDSLKARALLAGARGRPPCDVEAMAGLIAAFSRFVCEAGSPYGEIDLNPVRVLEAGRGVRVLDTLFVPERS